MSESRHTPLASETDSREGYLASIEAAVGGAYRMQDGRDFWMDAQVAREVAVRAADGASAWMRRHEPAAHPAVASVEGASPGPWLVGDDGMSVYSRPLYKPAPFTNKDGVRHEDFMAGLVALVYGPGDGGEVPRHNPRENAALIVAAVNSCYDSAASAPETAAERDRLLAVNRDLLAALKGPDDNEPQLWAISWVETLVNHFTETHDWKADEDPASASEGVSRVLAMCKAARAAIAKAEAATTTPPRPAPARRWCQCASPAPHREAQIPGALTFCRQCGEAIEAPTAAPAAVEGK